MKTRIILALACLQTSLAYAQFSQPYEWNYTVKNDVLSVNVEVPKNAYLYAKSTSVSVSDYEGKKLANIASPTAHPHTDEFGTADIYEGGKTHHWTFSIDANAKYNISVDYQGCGSPEGGGGAMCYPPSSKQFKIGGGVDTVIPESKADLNIIIPNELLNRFEIVRVDGGIMSPKQFLSFLDINSDPPEGNILAGKSTWVVILLILVGGLALNLTPCVLPMIPINLSIIGAGSSASNKTQGFIRGGVYGLGIALAYGGLGVFAVLTGSKFGSLNSLPLFNFSIAVVFIILALAMFDVFTIDLSRFSSRFGNSSKESRGKLIPAFVMGIVAALMAGACVAPIVIAVLLHSATLYATNKFLSLLLPLLLGIGMALPWPIAGAGMTVLPKPGTWMEHVKHAFGVLIILFAVYYIYLGVGLLPSSGSKGYSTEKALIELREDLEEALISEKPVMIDFWASWCKNCLKMEATTFKNEQVIERLHSFSEIKFQAEKLSDQRVDSIMTRYGLVGLPGYVILQPKK